MDNKYPWAMDKDLDEVFKDLTICIAKGFDTHGRLDYLLDRLRIAEAKVWELGGKPLTIDELFVELRKCHHVAVENNEIQEYIMAKHILENCNITRKATK